MMKRKADEVCRWGYVAKKRRNAVGGGCSFMQSWTTEFKTSKPSNRGQTKALCTICIIDDCRRSISTILTWVPENIKISARPLNSIGN